TLLRVCSGLRHDSTRVSVPAMMPTCAERVGAWSGWAHTVPELTMPKVPAGILLSLTLAASAPLAAQPQGSVASLEPTKAGGIDVDYAITFWTIPFGNTSVDARFGRNTYQTSSHFETRGLVSAFWGAIIDASPRRRLAHEGLTPAAYDSYYRRGEDKKQR